MIRKRTRKERSALELLIEARSYLDDSNLSEEADKLCELCQEIDEYIARRARKEEP